MKTKIVYVLVSSEKDIFLEQTLLSMISLKMHQPDAPVTLVVDNFTDKTLVGFRAQLKKYVDEYKVIDFEDNLSGHTRSRFIRTNLRNLISGDYLCIDGDTIIADKLEDIDQCEFEVGGIYDSHIDFKEYPRRKELIPLFKKLGFETDVYYNGGVIYTKDTPKAHQLFDYWNKFYKEGMEICKFDQPHLAHANVAMGNIIQPLDGIWDCHIMNGMKYLPHAKIIHYFASNFTSSKKIYPYKFMDKSLYEKIKREEKVDDSIMEMIKKPQEQWNDKLEVNSGSDLDLLHSKTMKLLQMVYYSKPNLFAKMESLIGYFSKRR